MTAVTVVVVVLLGGARAYLQEPATDVTAGVVVVLGGAFPQDPKGVLSAVAGAAPQRCVVVNNRVFTRQVCSCMLLHSF